MEETVFKALRRCIENHQIVSLVTVVAGPGTGGQLLVWPGGQTLGDLGSPRLNQRAGLYAEQLIATQVSARKTFELESTTVDVFFEVMAPPPTLVVVGAVHVAAHLLQFARELGFETVLVDPRPTLLNQERFASVDRKIGEWPDRKSTRLNSSHVRTSRMPSSA